MPGTRGSNHKLKIKPRIRSLRKIRKNLMFLLKNAELLSSKLLRFVEFAYLCFSSVSYSHQHRKVQSLLPSVLLMHFMMSDKKQKGRLLKPHDGKRCLVWLK